MSYKVLSNTIEVKSLAERLLSPKASELIEFDVNSLRQMVASRQGEPPDFWLADPDQYEINGRVLRDSSSPRLLAYSSEDRILYVTDGCNACMHSIEEELSQWSEDHIRAFSEGKKIRRELVQQLAAYYRNLHHT